MSMKSKNILLLLLTTFSLVLTGCSSRSTSPSNPSGGHSGHTEEDIEPTDEFTPVTSLSFNKSEDDLIIGQRENYLINFNEEALGDDNLIYREGTFSSSDSSIASVDEYGRITGNKVGDVIIYFTTNIGHRRARIYIYVWQTPGSISKEWKKVNSRNELHSNDVVVIACKEKNLTATSENTGMYLHPVESTFSSDKNKILELGEGTETFILGSDTKAPYEDALTMESESGDYLVCTNEKKVTFVNNKGNKYWMFTFESEGLYVESTSNIYGQLMYDERKGGFSLYDSSPQVDMFLITLYKLTIVR